MIKCEELYRKLLPDINRIVDSNRSWLRGSGLYSADDLRGEIMVALWNMTKKYPDIEMIDAGTSRLCFKIIYNSIKNIKREIATKKRSIHLMSVNQGSFTDSIPDRSKDQLSAVYVEEMISKVREHLRRISEMHDKFLVEMINPSKAMLKLIHAHTKKKYKKSQVPKFSRGIPAVLMAKRFGIKQYEAVSIIKDIRTIFLTLNCSAT